MPISELLKFREKYPQYNDLDDETLAEKLAMKFPKAYGDLPQKVVQETIGGIQTPETMQRDILERQIAQRPDIYSQAVQGFQQRFSPEGMKQPFTFPQEAEMILKSLGGVAQRAEAAIANPLIEMGRLPFRTMPQRMAESAIAGTRGERLGELGDPFRQARFPEPIAATAGLMGTGILMGALSKGVGLTRKADSLMKLQTTYGKDIGKTIIKHASGLSDEAVEYGMQRGWKNILTKENLKADIPTKTATKIVNSLDDIARDEYHMYGEAMDKAKEGSVKAIELNNTLQGKLMQENYLNADFSPTLKIKGTAVNKIFKFIDNAIKNKISPDENIPIPVIQSIKQTIKKIVPKAYWEGKKRTLTADQKFAKDTANLLDDLIGRYSTDANLTEAKRQYSIFKNAEAMITNLFKKPVGQKTVATGTKIRDIFKKFDRVGTLENLNILKQIEDFLASKGHGKFLNKLLDWDITQKFMISAEQQGMSFYPFRLLAESGKFATRQLLRSGIPSPIGKYTGRITQPLIPPSILRMITGRNK